jgi:hypothetical protein
MAEFYQTDRRLSPHLRLIPLKYGWIVKSARWQWLDKTKSDSQRVVLFASSP